MLSAAVGCGACVSCLAGNVVNCANNASDVYGLRNRLQGSQAQAVRVPAADFNAAVIPDGISANQALMLTDGMPTAWFGCLNAGIRPGSTVAVVGLGPIGLMAVESAMVMGASRVFAIDRLAERRDVAERLGATALGPDDAVEIIRDATAARMIECVIEAVGADATIALALRLAARRGTVSVLGVNHAKDFHFPMGRAFIKGLTFRIGTCSVPEHWPELIPLIQNGRLKPERWISHVLPLSEGPRAYALFDARAEGALKMVLLNY
jgi:threonine dehydrogenase-like Zn-dependent dehydrogenase